jgi:hypothetical protein
MKKFWRLVMRVIFWSYRRGSLPYDVMVIAILAFVLLTPRSWYHDQPKVGMRGAAGQIQLVDMDPATNTELFRVDASLLKLPSPTRELEKETHELLGRRVTSLQGKMFQIVQIQPVRAEDGTVTGYDVRIKHTHPPSQ